MAPEKLRSKTTEPVLLSDEEGVKEILVGTVFGLWDIVNNLTRLRPTTRPHYRVSIFGSARAKETTPEYQEVKELAAQLTAMGCEIITGGGPGLMQAANEGALSGRAKGDQQSVGIRVTLPFEQQVNEFVEQSYEHQTFFTRLHHFVLASDAFVVVPGGIGTVLETLMVWQLLQVKHLAPLPLILVGDMYKELVEWAKQHMVSSEHPLASPEDLEIPRCVSNSTQAVEIVRGYHAAWLAQRKSVTKS